MASNSVNMGPVWLRTCWRTSSWHLASFSFLIRSEQAAAGMAAGGPRRAEPKGEPGYISGEANPEGTGFREEQGYPEEQVCPETEGDAYTGEGGTKQAEEAGDVDETAATEAAAEYMGEPGYAGKGGLTCVCTFLCISRLAYVCTFLRISRLTRVYGFLRISRLTHVCGLLRISRLTCVCTFLYHGSRGGVHGRAGICRERCI